jgi:hypothetical protein
MQKWCHINHSIILKRVPSAHAQWVFFVLCVGIHISNERFFLVAMRACKGESQREAHRPSKKLQKNLTHRRHNNMSTPKPSATLQTSAPQRMIGAGATDSTSASVRTSAIFNTSISASISASASISTSAGASASAIDLSAISNSSASAIFSACVGTSTSNAMGFALQRKGQHQRQRQNQHHHQRQCQRHAIVLSTISNSSASAILNVWADTSTGNAMWFMIQRIRNRKDERKRKPKEPAIGPNCPRRNTSASAIPSKQCNCLQHNAPS